MTKPKMVSRTFRVPLRLWTDAMAKADEREENLSDVLREALEQYAATPRLSTSRRVDPCPECGAEVTSLDFDPHLRTTKTNCGHKVAAKVEPDRIELVKPTAP